MPTELKDTEPASDAGDELPPTLPPSRQEAEAAFRESQRAPSFSVANPGPRTLSESPAVAEMRGIRDAVVAGFAEQQKQTKKTRSEIARATRTSKANHAILHREVVGLKDSLITFRRETDERFVALETQVRALKDRVATLENEHKTTKDLVAALEKALETVRATPAQTQPPAG